MSWIQEQTKKWLANNIHRAEFPAAYVGGEPNTYTKKWRDAKYKIALTGAMSYRASIGNMSIPLLYQILNEARPEWIVERAYCPSSRKFWGLMEKGSVPIFSLESKHSIKEFDVVGFSICYQFPQFHIPRMLEMSGISAWSDKRTEEDPIIMLGGAHSFMTEPIAEFIDVFVIGEAEEVIVDILECIELGYAGVLSKGDILQRFCTEEWAKKGVYVPKYYKEMYKDNRLVGRETLLEGAPKVIKRAYPKDLDKVKPYTKPIIPFIEPGMGLGEVEVSRGCPGHCAFCMEGSTYAPYRERSTELVISSLKENMRYSGSTTGMAHAFDSGCHSQKKKLLVGLLERVTDRINYISQRADSFCDHDYAILSGMAGNKSVAIGVEGNSQRMREVYNKNITEQQILDSCRWAIRSGYKTIKLYFISNAPTEEEKDVKELYDLCKKIVKLKKEEGKPKTFIRVSWTPLTIQSFTPLQWHKPPLDKKSLSPILKDLIKLGVDITLGNKSKEDVIYTAQLLHLGDRRLASIIYELGVTHKVADFGLIRKGTKAKIEDLLKEKGLTWDNYFCEKGEDWIFSWDFIRAGYSKKWMWKRYQELLTSHSQTGLCTKGDCFGCGACDKEDLKNISEVRARTKSDIDKIKIEDIQVIRQSGSVRRGRVKFEVPFDLRFADNSYFKYELRRGGYLSNFPIGKEEMKVVSDLNKYKGWSYGVNYVEFGMYENVTDVNRWNALGESFCSMKFLGFKVYPFEIKTMYNVIGNVYYEMPLFGGVDEALGAIRKFKDSDVFEVRRRLKDFRSGIISDLVDAKKFVDDVWVWTDGKGAWLRFLIHGNLSPYEFYGGLLRKNQMQSFAAPARRIEVFKKSDDSFGYDLFSANCSCGKRIEENIFEEVYSGDLCLECYNKDTGEIL